MDLLPEDPLADILRRLPLGLLAVCRSVSTHLRAVIDGRVLLAAHLAPRGLRGIFVNNAGQSRPNLISRWAAAPHAVVDAELTSSHHINGLLLVQDCKKLYVCNQINAEHDFFYPTVSLHYVVISVSSEAPACCSKPSSLYGGPKVFSSRTGRWEGRAYVGEDDVAGLPCRMFSAIHMLAGSILSPLSSRWFNLISS